MTNGLLGALVGIFLGYQAFSIRRELSQIKSSLTKETASPSVVSSSSPVAHRAQAEVRTSQVVIPKSPQQVDWEENQELRKMNPGS